MRKIFEFNPVIFPTRVWVTMCPDIKLISRQFYALDEDGEIMDVFPADTFTDDKTVAQTTLVQHKKTNFYGCLVTIHRADEVTSGIMAHEASHCADWLCDQFGIYSCTFQTGETRSYYVQWVTECIEKVINKFRCNELRKRFS